MQAMAAPLSAKALPASAELCSSGPPTASMPPAARKLRAQVERAECAARSPSDARNTCGRLPVLARWASAASRSRSNGSASRRGCSGATEVPPLTTGSGVACGSTLTPSSASCGKAETPVSSRRPVAMSRARASATLPISAWMKPLSERGAHAALGLDRLEQLPCRLGQVLGQRLDEPGAVPRVHDAAERAFLLQHQVRVAGDAAGEGVGLAHRPGVGQHGNGIGAAERRPRAGHRGAQHVHPRIAPRHHALRRGGGEVQLVHAHARPRTPRRRAPPACGRRAAWRSSGTDRHPPPAPARSWRRPRAASGPPPRRRADRPPASPAWPPAPGPRWRRPRGRAGRRPRAR